LGGAGGRTGIGGPQNVVGTVTVLATRGQWVTAFGRSPVQAFHILLFFIRMARAAVDRGELGGVGKILFALQITVTIGALQRGVGRSPQSSLVEGGWHSRLALARAATGFVAIQARLASRQRLGLLSV
jgi:hypothetical protein